MFLEKISLIRVMVGCIVVASTAFVGTSGTAGANADQVNSSTTSFRCPNGLIQSRAAWAAQPAKSVFYLIVPLAYVTIHHTVTPTCLTFDSCAERMRNIQSYHMDQLGWGDIGFSYLIGGDGKVYEGVGWNKEGAHTYGWNKKSAGIAFIGNFQDATPSSEMLRAARELIDCGKSDGSLRDNVSVLGARQLVSTQSPGEKLYEEIKKWPNWSATP